MEATVQSFFVWLEGIALSKWLRESESMLAFPTILTLHTVSMAFLAGIGAIVDLRILGVARLAPLGEMRRLLPSMWLSLGVSVVTGAALLLAYPSKALTNPVFYVKLLLMAAALVILRLTIERVLNRPELEPAGASRRAKGLAVVSLACWILLIWAGRALPYTYGQLLAMDGTL